MTTMLNKNVEANNAELSQTKLSVPGSFLCTILDLDTISRNNTTKGTTTYFISYVGIILLSNVYTLIFISGDEKL